MWSISKLQRYWSIYFGKFLDVFYYTYMPLILYIGKHPPL